MTQTTDVEAFLAGVPKPEDPLIQRGRYQIIPADGGSPKPHTRITNFAKKLEDEYGLRKWEQRQVLLGAAQRPDLTLAALADSDDRERLDELVEQAHDAARANVRRESGTALHRIVERIDAGETLKLPAAVQSDADAYAAALASIGAEVELIEAVVVHEPLGLAGRLDRTVFVPTPTGERRRYIGDLKTGEDLSYSWGSIAIQLACYADATTIYDPDKKKHSPMPPVDQGRALVIHLPAGKATASLYWVNLEAGRRGIQLTQQLLEWRRGAKKLASIEPLQFVARPDLREYVRDRVKYVVDQGYGAQLAAAWPAGVPTLKASDAHGEAQLDLVLFECSEIEARHRLPFPALTDPRNL